LKVHGQAIAPSWSVTPLTLEGGQGLARLDHDRRRLTAATTLSHHFSGKFQDRLIGRGYRLLSLDSEFGLAECRPSTSLFHRKSIILDWFRQASHGNLHFATGK
jgi:hypothetical protein